jgi:glycosyltransferase involved in cell wall biosynthesis
MHICYVIAAYHASRDDIWLPAIVDTIERVAAVHEVTVIALRQPTRRPAYTLAGARVVTLGLESSHGPLGRAQVLCGGIAAVLRRHRQRPIDLVHGVWADEAGAVAVVAARLMRRPSFVYAIGGELVALPDIGYGGALGRGGRLTTRLSLALADVVVAQSGTTLSLVRARGRTRDTHLIPTGVDTAVFHAPRADAHTTGTQRILFVGNLIPVKDPMLLLAAFARVAATRAAVTLEYVGDGAQRGAIEERAAQLGLAGRVVVRGQVSRDELADLYRTATLLAVPSRSEGQPLVAAEAIASGLPVVGTRVGILPDLDAAALVVDVGDGAELADALASVLDDPAKQRAMSGAALELAHSYDLDVTAGALLKLYERFAPGATRS